MIEAPPTDADGAKVPLLTGWQNWTSPALRTSTETSTSDIDHRCLLVQTPNTSHFKHVPRGYARRCISMSALRSHNLQNFTVVSSAPGQGTQYYLCFFFLLRSAQEFMCALTLSKMCFSGGVICLGRRGAGC